MFRHRLKLLAILFLVATATVLSGQPVRRHILALYNSDSDQKPNKNHIHENAEVILNYLGCVLDYWDISQGLPDDKSMQKYLGVLVWFYDYTWEDPEHYEVENLRF